jgi:hypothetical protein
MRHSLSTAAVTVVAAEVAASMAAVEAVSMVAAEAFTVVVGASTVADLTAAGGLLVEAVTTKGEVFVAGEGRVLAEREAVMEGAAVRMAGMELGAVSG